MSRMLNRKSAVIAGILALIVAGGAYAYFTQTGTGTGSAVTQSGTAVTVVQTSAAITDLYPGAAAQTLSGKFTNTNAGTAYVHQVDATISSVTGPNVTDTPTCTTADYQLNGFPVTVDAEIPVGTNQGAWGIAAPGVGATTIEMLDPNTNQDSCKGATVNVSYTSN